MNLNPYFKSIIDQDREAVVICDLNHIIIYMNPAAVVDYGKYGGASLLGKCRLACHNPHSVEAIRKVVEWFAADASHNIVYTYHNAKHNRHPDRLLRKARLPQSRDDGAVRFVLTKKGELHTKKTLPPTPVRRCYSAIPPA